MTGGGRLAGTFPAPRRAIVTRALAIVMFLGACTADLPAESTDEAGLEVCGSGPTVKGIDVSYYQGTIDWARVRADGVEFAFSRISDGLNTIDSKFAANWAGSKAAGVLRGAYQYFRPSQDALAQADLFLEKLGPLGADDLPPVIDVEADGGLSPSQVAAKVRIWIDRVEAATGRRPIIYTGFYFWRDSVGSADFLPSPLWHAQYTTAACPNIAAPWTDWALWQFTDSGRVAGITGNVDVNRFNGTREQLLALTGEPRACGVIPAEGGLIDDGDACFRAGGTPTSLRQVSTVGEGSDLIWTHTTDRATEDNYAEWSLVFAEGGRYQLEVSTPAAYAQSTQARYQLELGGVAQEVVLDQTAVDGWQSLGAFDVTAGGEQRVHLGDNTGEPGAEMVKLVFDGLRITRLDGGSGSGSDAGSGSGAEPGAEPGEEGGCTAGGGGAGLVVALAALRRRRRRRRQR